MYNSVSSNELSIFQLPSAQGDESDRMLMWVRNLDWAISSYMDDLTWNKWLLEINDIPWNSTKKLVMHAWLVNRVKKRLFLIKNCSLQDIEKPQKEIIFLLKCCFFEWSFYFRWIEIYQEGTLFSFTSHSPDRRHGILFRPIFRNSQTLIPSKNFWKLTFLSSNSENLNDFVDAPLVTVGVSGVWNDVM